MIGNILMTNLIFFSVCHDLPTIVPPSYDIAIKNSSLTSDVQPVDDDDSGWADFQTSSSCMDNWADFNQSNFDSNIRKENLQNNASIAVPNSSPFTEQKYSVDSESSSFDLDSTHSASSTTSSSLVTIVKDNLQKKEILSLFKVRDDLSRIHPSQSVQSEIATGTSGEGSGELGIDGGEEFDMKKAKSKQNHDPNNPAAASVAPTILARSCQKQQQGFKKVTTPVTASNVSLDLSSSDMDLFQEPPPLDDQIEVEDEFGGFSQEIDDFELSDRANFPNTAHRVNVRSSLGLGIAPRSRTNESVTIDSQSSIPTSQSGNFDFVDEDSHSSKDTDSLSWQDRPKFQKEDSQSVSSLELSYNSAGRPAQRDLDLAADSQSVSSSEFPAFETLQKQETALESKSLDSLEFRNDEPVWGEICDNSGDTVSEDNKNRNIQNLTAETNSGKIVF